MKLISFEFKKYHEDITGIKTGLYERLPTLICLVGKNGSGKSRILNIIKRNSMFLSA